MPFLRNSNPCYVTYLQTFRSSGAISFNRLDKILATNDSKTLTFKRVAFFTLLSSICKLSMKIKQFGNELIIQETPSGLWVFGSIAAVIGACFIYLGLGGGTHENQPAPWVLFPTLIIGIIAVVSGYLLIFNAPATKIIIDRYSKTVTFRRIGLFGKKQTVYDFNAIKKFCVIEDIDDERCPIWSLGMELTEGETIKISALPNNNEKVKLNFVLQSNQFMYKQMPSFSNDFLLEDEN